MYVMEWKYAIELTASQSGKIPTTTKSQSVISSGIGVYNIQTFGERIYRAQKVFGVGKEKRTR